METGFSDAISMNKNISERKRMSDIRRYLEILELSGAIMRDMEKGGTIVDTIGHDNVSQIRRIAFAQLIRDGMPADLTGNMLTINDSGAAFNATFEELTDYLDPTTALRVFPDTDENNEWALPPRSPDADKIDTGGEVSAQNKETAENIPSVPDKAHNPENTKQEGLLPQTIQRKQGPSVSGGEIIQEDAGKTATPLLSGLMKPHMPVPTDPEAPLAFHKNNIQSTELDITVLDPEGNEADLVQIYALPINDHGVLSLLAGSEYFDDTDGTGRYVYTTKYGSGSIKFLFGQFSVLIKGSMDMDGVLNLKVMLARDFASKGYILQTKELRKDGGDVHIHPFISDGEGYDIHILPVGENNNPSGYADFFAVIFDGDKSSTVYNMGEKYAHVMYKGKNGALAAQWGNDGTIQAGIGPLQDGKGENG